MIDRIKLSDTVSKEYYNTVQDILENRDFVKLRFYTQHNTSNRLIHSINVSYLSWILARKLHCDESIAARAGLLHDFCLFDFSEKSPTGEHQAFFHPKAAADNGVEYFNINKKEREAILSHMYPLGPLPKSREAWIISLIDKVCATMELCHITIALARKGRISIIPLM